MFEFNFECLLFRSIFDKTQPDPSPTDNFNSNWWLTVELDPTIALNHHPHTRISQNPLYNKKIYVVKPYLSGGRRN